MIVWDTGTYHNITEENGKPLPAERAVENGHISFCLSGKKLNGGFSLRRFKTGDDEAWLLMKMADEYANAASDALKTKPESVLSGRTIDELAVEE